MTIMKGGVMEDKDSVCVWRFSDAIVPQYVWPYATECGAEFMLLEEDDELAEQGFHYCPNCG